MAIKLKTDYLNGFVEDHEYSLIKSAVAAARDSY